MGRAAEMTAADVGPSIADALWLGTLHRICGRAAHELKGALNGVSVNLEVVRSRSEKADVPASKVNTFANAAVDQLGVVISMTDALLSLARPLREPMDLGLLLARFHALLAPAVRVDGGSVQLDAALVDVGTTSARGSAVGVSVGGCLLAAIEASSDVRCRPVLGGLAPVIRIECGDGAQPSLDREIVGVAADAGIHIVTESSVISISFPR